MNGELQSKDFHSRLAPAPHRCRWRLLFLLLPLTLYAAWFAFAYANQEHMLFPGADRPKANNGAAVATTTGRGTPDVPQSVWLTMDDGVRVEAWYAPGRGRSAASPGPAVMYFHGNADLIDTTWPGLRTYLDEGVSVLLMEYRGYGRTGGSPSQAAIVADAVRFRDWLAEQPEVDGRIIYHGLSLGGGVANALAAQRTPAALILECTFTSMEAIAHRYLLPGSLCRHPFRTDRVIAQLDCPILIMHGRHDDTIPVAHGRRLHELARGSRYVELDCGHHDYRTDWGAVRSLLRDAGLLLAP